jgi:putative FmdB family regulatory protein
MPIYEYVCTGCNKKFEMFRPLSQAEADAACAACGGKAKRVLSRFAAVSKGSGGESTPITGGGCSTCGASSCTTCGS